MTFLLAKSVAIDSPNGFGSLSAENSPHRDAPAAVVPEAPAGDFTEEDLIPPVDQIKSDIEARIKRKAKRPSRSVDLPEEAYVGTGTLSASLPSHFTFEGFVSKGWLKKHSKNSRRSRRGRGLAKKGTSFCFNLISILTPVALPKKLTLVVVAIFIYIFTTGGAGGKGTWGKLVDVEETLDDNYDPNYDSDNQENCEYVEITPPLTDSEIEKHASSIITEYFEHGDTDEVALSLEEFNFDGKQYQVVVIGITLAMEHKSSHRELTSILISDLYGRILRIPDYERAFKTLIKSLPDLVLDTPDAAIVLGNFLARAVADDCIQPSFINKLKAMPSDCALAVSCVEHASVLLEMEHGLVKLDSVWGITGGMRPVYTLVSRIHLLLAEYISSEDVKEASICLKELEVPHFHHELVYEAVIAALESMNERTLQLIADLLAYLCKTMMVTVDQLLNGFRRVYEEINDISLDVPLAYPLLERLISKCNSKGFFPAVLIEELPQRYVLLFAFLIHTFKT